MCKKQNIKRKYFSYDELQDALNTIIKQNQAESFSEYNLLLNGQSLPQKSYLLKFNAYLDNNNVMHLGGRLDNSIFSYDKKHLISTHPFTETLFNFEHKQLTNAGPLFLLPSIREGLTGLQTYWPGTGK